jgi:hypothetical protein
MKPSKDHSTPTRKIRHSDCPHLLLAWELGSTAAHIRNAAGPASVADGFERVSTRPVHQRTEKESLPMASRALQAGV